MIFKIFIKQKVKKHQPSLTYNLSTNNEKPKTFTAMKKLLYILAIIFTCTTAITSCTEEEVKPSTTSEVNSGGGAYDELGTPAK